jgi:hypothetical protein
MAEEKQEKQNPPSVVTDVNCPICKTGFIASRIGKYGLYWTCNSDKRCRYNLSAKPTGRHCGFKRGATKGDVCGALMVEGTKTIPERCSDKGCPNRNPHKLGKM